MPTKTRQTGQGTILFGTNGDDNLSGLEGAYILKGGNGNDTYIVDGDDTVDEKNNGGTDLVIAHVDWTLGEHLENLTLAGSEDLAGSGNESDNAIAGNSGANVLHGLGGNDTLDGGDGDDSVYGGAGDDTLVGGAGRDLIDGGSGIDTAIFAGLFDSYSFAWNEGDLLVTTAAGESDILRNVEFLSFDGQIIAASEVGGGPVAVEDAAAVGEDSAISIPVMDNDLGQGIWVALAHDGAKGAVTINDDGTLTYRPDANATGMDSFTYTIKDANGMTSSTTVTLSIEDVNDAPVAQADSYVVAEDESLAVAAAGVLVNDSDVDGDALSINTTPVEDVAHGSLTLDADGSFTYTPDANFFGEDSFTYEASDGRGGTATATVTLTVEPVNDAPVAVDDNFATTEGTDLSGAVLYNDSDPDGDPLTVSDYDETTVHGGTVSMEFDGKFSYTPANGFTGTDSFDYAVSDGQGGADTATVSLNVDSAASDSTVVDVSDAAQLMQALQNAEGGEIIRLAAGDYGELALNVAKQSWAAFQSNVTITSADSSAPASFSRMDLQGVTNLTFDGVTFDYDAAPGTPTYDKPFVIRDGSQDITIRNSVFDGDFAEGVDDIADGHGTGFGIVVTDSARITIDSNEFYHWHRGGVFGNVQDLNVSSNNMYAITGDALNFAAVQGVLIEGNYIHDFDRAEGSTHHSDMIQFWTNGTDTPSVDIIIRGNILMSGEGDLTQSIFMRNDLVDRGLAGEEMFYRNILIEDNLIHNAHLHGITVGETDGLTIRNNTLLHNADSGDSGSVNVPRINVATDSTNVTIDHNIASAVPAAQSGWTVADNLLVQRDSPSLPNYYDDLFVNVTDDALAEIADLQALPGGLIETEGYGAAITRYDATPDELTALLRPTKVEGEIAQFSFDASFTADPTGPVGDGEAQFLWNFGDGTTGEGIAPTHEYATHGTYIVTLEVVTGDGTSDTTEARIEVPDPLLLDVDVEDGMLLDTSSYAASLKASDVVITSGRNGNEAVYLDADSGFSFDRSEIDQIFDLDEFSLSFGLRADAAGEILRIHTALDVDLDADGRIVVTFTNAAEETFTLFSHPGLLDGKWHNVTVTFDGGEGSLEVYVDGALSGATAAAGHTQPMESWGLSVGGVWATGFTGELDALEMRGAALEAGDIQIHHDMLTYDGTFDML